jgi:RNA polymerase sigma-70 factor, ECF subfamily
VETFTCDENYVTSLRNRDQQTEAHFVAHFKLPVWLKARRQLRTNDLADDACQETLLRVLRYFHSGKTLDNPERLPSFVYSVCHNVTLEMIRTKDRYRQMGDQNAEPADERIDPELVLVTSERKRLVLETLAQLSERDREVLRLAILEEVDKAEVCRRFNVSEDYLRVLLHRARLRFRDALVRSQDVGTPRFTDRVKR